MKSTSTLGALALFFAASSAFPTLKEEAFSWSPFDAPKDNEKRQTVTPDQGVGFLPLTPPPFDAKAQYVSTTGAHAFQAPGSTDSRGECPGLNSLANHGYLPRNGNANIQQFIQGTYQGLGMAQDLSGFLAIYGSLVDGDGKSWLIGGVPHTGISGSHNNYETDSSPLKSDLNQYGYNGKLIMSQFKTLYNMQPNAATANYNLDVMQKFRSLRFTESVAKNPYFDYGPFTGIQVSQAAFTFIYRFMSNKSAEHPEGILTKNVLKSFMSISGPENALVWTPGHERIPDNWYKRNDADTYTIPYFESDLNMFGLRDPRIFTVGCNQGAVNTYNPIDPAALTGGAYTTSSVQSSPLCFSAAVTMAQIEGGAYGLPTSVLNPLASLFNSTFGQGCAKVNKLNSALLSSCPGYSTYGGPTGPVAPGAIQS